MQTTAWRIVRKQYADTAFSGLGAEKYGGRWNSPGRKLVYASDSLALAALEILVHLPYPAPPNFHKTCSYQAFKLELPNEYIQSLTESELPIDWKSEPPSPSTQTLGNQWLHEKTSLGLRLPSVLVPLERTLLLNPEHEDFAKLKIYAPVPYSLDPRLVP